MTLNTVFWNQDQRRLRTFWRLLLQFLLMFIFTGCLGASWGLLWGIGQVIGGGEVDLSTLLVNLNQNSPGFVVVTGVTSLVATLLSVVLAGRFLDRRPFKAFGFHLSVSWWADLAFGLGLGIVLMAMIFLIEWGAGWITLNPSIANTHRGIAFATSILVQALFFLCVSIYEELLFRGYQLQNLAEGLNPPALSPKIAILLSWLGSSILFGLGHVGNPNTTWVSTLNLMLAGIFLGLGYVLTGELALSIGLHITWNFFQGTVFGFPVSGGNFGASLITIEQGGPTLWTGGAFGPEAGLLGIFAILIGSVLLVLWVRWRYGSVTLAPQLATYEK